MVRAQLGPPSKQKHLQTFVSAFLLYPNFGLTIFPITTHLPLNGSPPSSFVTRHSSFLPLFRPYISPLKIASNSFVCASRERSMCKEKYFHHITFPFSVPTFSLSLGEGRGEDSSFFRLETPFLPFLTLLYYIINQLFIYPSYTNRPRFV